MKKITILKQALIALLMVVAWFATIDAKGQGSCSTSTLITPTATCDSTTYHITSTDYWLKFVATNKHIRIALALPNHTPQANISHFYLYKGNCSTMTLLAQNNSAMMIDDTNLTIGSTYYIKVVQPFHTSAYFGLRVFYYTPSYYIAFLFGTPPLTAGYYTICCGHDVPITNYTTPTPTTGTYGVWVDISGNFQWICGIPASSFGYGITYTIPASAIPCGWFQPPSYTLNLYLTYPSTSPPICGDYAYLPLTVYPAPTITLTAHPSPICSGQSTTLTASGGSTGSYNWCCGIPSTSYQVVVSPSSSGYYSVTGTNSYGCTNDANVYVTVNPSPTVTVTASVNPVCSGSPTTLTANGASTYHWSTGSNANPLVVSPTTATTYTVTGTSAGCANTASITINVFPNPVVNITASPSCIGTATTLTASASGGTPPYHFNWCCSGIASGTGNMYYTVYPSTSGTPYYVVAIDNNGCVGSANITVTAHPLPIANAGPDITICAGENTTQHIGPSSPALFMSYAWSPTTGLSNPNIYNPIANPTASTTYTLTVTNNLSGCSASDNVTVTVNPVPIIPIIIGDSISCASPVWSVQNVQTGITYTWTGPSGITFSPHIAGNPAIGTGTSITVTSCPPGFVVANLIVTATNSYGCTSTGYFTVYECCGQTTGIHAFVNKQASDIILQWGNPVSATLYINGTLTINHDIKFLGNNVYMGPNSYIILEPTYTLTIDKTAHLQSPCNYMWKGITIPNNTATLIVSGASIIEDADYAVVSNNGGYFNITNSYLQNDYQDIIINTYAGNYGSYISGSTLWCTRDLYAPHLYDRTNTGITITELTPKWTIGDASGGITNQNLFQNMWYGIRSTKTNDFAPQDLSIVNNNFTTINTSYASTVHPLIHTISPGAGIAIYYASNSNAIPWVASSLTVGGGTPAFANEFNGCTRGIECFRHTNTFIQGNNFTNVWNGVYVDNVWQEPITITNNIFDNTGGSGSYAISTLFTRSALSITKNKINPSASTIADVGIRVADNSHLTGYTESTDVSYNNITNAFTGIFGTVPAGYVQPTFKTEFNTITMPPTLSNIHYNYGIRLESCVPASVGNNTISWSGTPNSTYVDWLQGIRVMDSKGSMIGSNVINNMGSGIRCSGDENPTIIGCNKMIKCYRGIFMEATNIGDQGKIAEPNDNQWINNLSNYRVFGYLMSIAPMHTWFYSTDMGGNFTLHKYSYPLYPIQQYYVSLPSLFTTIGEPSGGACSGGGMAMINPDSITTSAQRQNYLSIDSTNLNAVNVSAYTDPSEYFVKENAHQLLKQDTMLLHLGLPDDMVYQQFFNRVNASNIHKFDTVSKMISAQMFAPALMQNTSVAPLNQMEINSKIVNNIFLNTWANQQFVLSSPDSAILRFIAKQNPLIAGEGVYLARVMLQYYPDNKLPLDIYRLADDDNIATAESKQAVRVYPNPAKNEVTVLFNNINNEKCIFELYSTIGDKVYSKTFIANEYSTNIPLINISNGVYICRILDANNINLYKDKLIIIK